MTASVAINAAKGLNDNRHNGDANLSFYNDVDDDTYELVHDVKPKKTPAKKAKREDIFKADTSLGKFLSNVHVSKTAPIALNATSIVCNIASALGEIFKNKISKSTQSLAKNFGEFGYRMFLVTNGTINFLEQLYLKNYSSALANFGDNFIALFAKRDLSYLWRGVIVGGYTIAGSLSILNDKFQFENLGEHVNHTVQGLVDSAKLLFSKDIFRNLLSSKNGLLGTLSGVFMMVGTGLWTITGNKKLSSTIRDIGGIMVDIERIKPGHIIEKRPFYFMAGACYTIGTVCDYISNWIPKSKDLLVTAQILSDSFGRIFLRESNVRGELEQKDVDEYNPDFA